MSRAGKSLICGLRRFLADVEAGRPVSQCIVRRMTVKGRTVYTREAYRAPLLPTKDGPA